MLAPMFLALSTAVSFPADRVTTVQMDPQTVTASAQVVVMDAEMLVADLPAMQMEPEVVVVATSIQMDPEVLVASGTPHVGAQNARTARLAPATVQPRAWARFMGYVLPRARSAKSAR